MTDWWKKTTVYQIYPRSFADSNRDGIGDLPGILSRLDYLRSLGVETLWLSPFFASPQRDFGYDIKDYLSIAPEYGTLQDCQRLIEEVHARGMKIVFDMVLNHTSDEHPWFVSSKQSRSSPHSDFYIWRDGRGDRPPNNWRSMLGPSGWHYEPSRAQWYWASFLPFQPDLNYRNPEVKQAMLNVVRHWLSLGVDGLRLDIFNAIFKDDSFADNPFSLRLLPSEDDPAGFFQSPKYTIDHPDTIAFARELRAVLDEFSPPRFAVGEVFGPPSKLRQYCGADGLHLVFLFKTLKTTFTESALRGLLEEFEREFSDRATWVFGNHDRARPIERLEDNIQHARLMAMLQLTARGVPFLYYGDELGMLHAEIKLKDAKDPLAASFRWSPDCLRGLARRRGILINRDECRAPMPWTMQANAGFCAPDVQPWLPLPKQWRSRNVASEEADQGSMLWLYRRLLSLRKTEPALYEGDLQLLPRATPGVLSWRRSHPDARSIDTIVNLSSAPLKLPQGQVLCSTTPIQDDLLYPQEGVVCVPRD